MEQPSTSPGAVVPAPQANPHVLRRQVVGLVFWVGLLALPLGSLIQAALLIALGGVTFADAWCSGIYKHTDRNSFLNMSPMAWGISMAFLFIVAYPVYLLNRKKLRTIQGTDVFYWATVVLGAGLSALFFLSIFGKLR